MAGLLMMRRSDRDGDGQDDMGGASNLWKLLPGNRSCPSFLTLTHKTMDKRQRSDSAASAVKAMASAAMSPLLPLNHASITENALPFWHNVLCARARDEWSDADLVIAAQLAQCMADMHEETAELRAEGRIIQNERGTMVMNPRNAALEQMARRELALMRSLRMTGRVAGDSRDESGGRRIEAQSRRIRAELEEDDLLA